MKIICIGRNYKAHAQELNNDIPTEPVFFMKPDSAILQKNHDFFIPTFSSEIHYEVEVLVKILKIGKNISPKFARRYYQEIGLGIDFTARDIQDKCKEKGLPWEIAKAFDKSAVIGNFVDKSKFDDVQNINFQLLKNDTIVQKSNTSEMIFTIDNIIAYVSQFVTLKIGDIIFTGTPAGVGKVHSGDKLKGVIEDACFFDFSIK